MCINTTQGLDNELIHIYYLLEKIINLLKFKNGTGQEKWRGWLYKLCIRNVYRDTDINVVF